MDTPPHGNTTDDNYPEEILPVIEADSDLDLAHLPEEILPVTETELNLDINPDV